MQPHPKFTVLEQRPRRSAAPRRLADPVKVVAVTGGKGGVGKSVICANLAVRSAMMQKRTLLLDGDLGLANSNLLLGLRPTAGLREVLLSERSLADVLVEGPAGLKLVPGSSGQVEMANMTPAQHAGIVRAFGDLEQRFDSLFVDTAAGISDSVIQFAGAAQHIIVVVCDEPASLADAYAIIKVLYQEKGRDQFQIVTNMSRHGDDERVFGKLVNVAERFLPVALHHAGSIPYDHRLVRSVQKQVPLVTAYPRSLAALSLRRLADRVDGWHVPATAGGGIEFFVEQMLGLSPAVTRRTS